MNTQTEEYDDAALDTDEIHETADADALDGAAYAASVDFSGPQPVVLDDTEDPDVVDDETTAEPYFANAAQWVEQWLIPHYKRNPRTHLWDERWWEYTEVVAVFEALWQAWEYLRVDSLLGPAVFFRDYLWPAMREITGPEGPFYQVQSARGRALPDPLPTAPVPDGLYRPAGHPDEQ